MIILEAKNVSKVFGGVRAVANASLSIRSRTITSIVGSNGSGKTTLFNILGGFLAQDSGVVSYKGRQVDRLNPAKRAAIGMGRLWQDIRLFKNMTVLENLLVARKNQFGERIVNCLVQPRRVIAQDKQGLKSADEILDFIRLSDKRRALAKDLSYGEQKLLAVGRLLMNDAELLLFDELTSGINPVMIDEVLGLVKEMVKRGKTVLMIEHNVPKAISVSENVYVMNGGRLEPRRASSESLLKEVYLSV